MEASRRYINSTQPKDDDVNSVQESNKRSESVRVSLEERMKQLDDRERELIGFRGDLELKERQLGMMGKSVEERLKEVELREEKVKVVLEELKADEKQFEEIQESIGRRIKEQVEELDDKEREFNVFRDEQVNELDSRDKQLAERIKQVELREEKVKVIFEKFKAKEKRFEDIRHTVEEKIDWIGSRVKELDAKEKDLGRRVKELDAKEEDFERRVKEVNAKEEALGKRVKELDAKEEDFERRVEEVNAKEKDLGTHVKELDAKEEDLERRVKEVNAKEEDLGKQGKVLDTKEEDFERRVKEVNAKERYLGRRVKELDAKAEDFEGRVKQANAKEKDLGRRVKELDAKEEDFEGRVKEVNAKEEDIGRRAEELDAKEEDFDGQVKEVNAKEEDLGRRVKELDAKEEDFETRVKEFNAKEEDIGTRVTELDAKEEDFERQINAKEEDLGKRGKVLDAKEEDFERQVKEVNAKEEEFEKRRRELEYKEKELSDLREIGSMRKEISNVDPTNVKMEHEFEDNPANSSTSLQFFAKMDGKGLQSFLNQHEKDHHLMAEEVYRGLRSTSNPAKLVLDAMEGFYCHPDKENREFQSNVTRKSCVLLLEQLHRISPQVSPQVKAQAMELVSQWKVKLGTVPDSMEVLGLLYLSACYRLPTLFDANQLLGLFEIVAEHRLAPELCRILGFTDRVPDLFCRLVRKNRVLVAVRFVYEFGLVDEFPPALLLKDYVKQLRTESKRMLRSNNSRTSQNAIIDNRVAALREVIKCIIDHKLESLYSPKSIEDSIKHLLKQKEDNKDTAPPPSSKPVEQESKRESQPSINSLIVSNPPSTATRFLKPVSTKLVPVTHMDFERRVKKVNAKEEDVGKRVKELDAKEEDFERRVKEVNAKEEGLGKRFKELDTKEEDFERQVKAREEEFEKRRMELEYKEKELSDIREIGSMGTENSNVDPTNVKMEHEFEDNLVNSSTSIQFFTKMDGKGLQSFLNEHEKDHHLLAEEVYQGLRSSSNPAKLVLDAMDGFYCHPNIKENRMFQLNVTRKSCILLLEQLHRISPQVSPQITAEAMKLACQWKVRMRPVPDSMEVLGHFYLSASYGLPTLFDARKLFHLFGIVAEHKQAPELCRILGFADGVPDLVRSLLRKNHVLVAVRFVYEFGLVNEFSPALLLKDYVKHLRTESKRMLRSNNSRTLQNAIIDKRVAALREVIKCIIDHKLESLYSPKSIEHSIAYILRQKGDNKDTAPQASSKPVELESKRESQPSINSLIVSSPPSPATRFLKPVGTKLVPVTHMAFILAHMDGERLQHFLNEHFEDHELMRNEVLLALQHSSDPGRLVLDAMKGFHLPNGKVGVDHFEVNVVRSSCILLLEQLMRLQIHLQPQMKGEAMVVAHHLESNMRDEIENPQVMLGFFQFIGAFGLTSCFDCDELHCLFEKIGSHPHARELCQLLGFAEKDRGCVLHPHVINEGSSLENVPLDKAVNSVNASLEHDSNSLGDETDEKNEVPIFRHASDPAKLVLDAIRGGYHSILEKGSNCPKAKIMDTFSSLLEQLMGASPHIKSQVQELATSFSIEWKSKLSVCRNNEGEVKAFMNLLATYKLDSSVMFEVLHGLLETVPEYEKKFELYRDLNFAHKTPDYIQYLIDNDKRLRAIEFIYEFKLVEKFPPVPILTSHLHYIEKHCTKICEEGDNSSKALDEAAEKEVELLRAVINCLTIHKIECDCTPENLQVRIDHIKQQKQDQKMKTKTKLGTKKRVVNLVEGQQKEEEEAKRRRLSKPLTATELENKEEKLSGLREIGSMGTETSNVDPTNVKMEHELEDNTGNSSTSIQFFAKMDGKGLQSFLNEHEKDHDLMAEDVYQGLQLSSDPAKLVLDAMQGFYCHPDDKENGGFILNVTRKSCILLLEQLQRISPQVSPQVKAQAKELVCQWRVRMRPVPDSMEVLGHLYLSASYRLPTLFDANQLLGLFEIVAEHRLAPQLFRILRFTDRVPDLIRSLVRKNRVLVAVRFVYEFGLVGDFSPALLLKDYVKQLRFKSRRMLKGNNSRTLQNAIIDKCVTALREVIKCIIDHKLESLYSPKSIEHSIADFLRLKGDNNGTAPPPSSKPVEQEIKRESQPSISSLIVSNPPSSATHFLKPFGTTLVPVTHMAFILANMDGERLQLFLNEHFKDHELMRDEVLIALQHTFDPKRLVLNAIKGFYPQDRKVGDEHFEANVIRGSCILLLEQLMRLQRHVPHVECEVIEIAHQWILKMKNEIENPQVILGFLLFIAAFRLMSHFGSDELHCLFKKIAPHPHPRELCQLLGFAEKNNGCVLHPRVINEGSSLENAPLDKMDGKKEVPIFRYLSDPAKLVLDAIRCGYHSILEKGSNYPKAKIMDTFSSLLEQLMGASPDIKSQVQEQARAFSIEWKSKLSVCRENEAEVKAFMNLLATYKLDSSVMFEVLHGLLKTVPEYKQKFELYRHLSFAHKTPDYIQYLIEKDDRLLAIRFIYEFELVEKFPPVPILTSHLHYIEKHCTKICEEGHNSHKARDKAANKEAELLRAVIKYLTIHKIECDWTPENLQARIDLITKQKQDRKIKKILGKKKRVVNLVEGQPLEEEDEAKRRRLSKPLTATGQGLLEEEFEKHMKKVENKEKELSDLGEIGSMGTKISNVDPTNVKIKLELEDQPGNSSTSIHFFAKMDGKGLQSFLNQHEKDHHLMAEEVYRGLQSSSDPAKLVLDAMEGFYCHPDDKDNRGFQLNVTRKSCVLLLEQLQRISPQVSPQVKAQAMELICQWKVKLGPVPVLMEVLGHLYLSACYRLPILFDANQLLGLFEIVAAHRQAPELCRILGFIDRVPDLIRNLVRKNHILVAVRFVSEFGLVDEFPPALLLKDYLKDLKGISRKMLRSNNSSISQNAMIDKRVAALREVIKCIIDNKLESMYSPKSIEQSIEDILRQKGDNNGTAPPPSSKPVEQESKRESQPSINSLIVSNHPSTATCSSKPVASKITTVIDLAFILANMDGERLLFFLNGHFEDSDLMRNVVLIALQHSFDPERLVLNAIQGFHRQDRKVGDGHFEDNVIRRSCILLLEQLMKLQRHLLGVKGEVIEIAHQWKLKMKDEIENPQVILGFLQFVAAFGLTAHIDSNELHCLFEKIAPHPHALELCQLLGFAEKYPGCVLHPTNEGSSLENAPLDKAVSLEHDSNLLGDKMDGNNEVPIFRYVSDPAKLVLDAIRGCYQSVLEKGCTCPKAMIMDTFSSLLEQLMGASPQIESQVQEQAMAFSIEWKSKLSVCRKNEGEVKAFMNLLATYKLDSSVMFEVLHGLLETVPEYEKKFELYRHLSFAHKTPDYIRYLIDNDERLLAIRFIYEFELVEKFPPVPILKSHLHYIETHCTKICEEGDNSPKALDEAADKETELLNAVLKCLIVHKIECDYTPENLQVRIDQIKKQKQDRKLKFGTKKRVINLVEGQPQEEDEAKRRRLSKPLTATGQGRAHLPWQYGHRDMPSLGWVYIPTTPYVYRPWQ